MLLLSTGTINAEIEQTYYEGHDIICENKWLISRSVDEAEYESLPLSVDTKQRSATIFEDKVIVGSSRPTELIDEFGNLINKDVAHIFIFNLKSGTLENDVTLTCNGELITGLLCANQVGTDSYGNLWFAGSNAGQRTQPIKVYRIDDINTGDCSLAAELSVPEQSEYYFPRLDYYDIVGDITGIKSHAILMSAAQSDNLVYRWKREKGKSEWLGDFNGNDTCRITSTYPKLYGNNWMASMVSIIDDDYHSGTNFLVDASYTYPAKYNTNGEIVDGLNPSQVNTNELPYKGTNGIIEFSIADKQFVAYSLDDVTQLYQHNCVRISKINNSYSNIERYWDLRYLGTTSDSGTHYHCLDVKKVTDSYGNEAVYLLNYKSSNGIGVYLIAEKGFNEDNITGINTTTEPQIEVKTEIARYDIHGRLLTKPSTGINIVRYSDGTTGIQLIK